MSGVMDGMDRLAALEIPPPDANDPLPIVLAKDGAVVVSYMTYIARKDVCMIVSFPHCLRHAYGQALSEHPLAPRGLKPFSVYEVQGSSWLRALGGGKDEFSRSWKHFLFAFKDVLFECVARDYGAEQIEDDDDTVRLMSKRLYK